MLFRTRRLTPTLSLKHLGIQRLFEVPVRVNSRHVGLSMAQHRLTDRDVLGHIVCPSAQAVTKAVPAKTLIRSDLWLPKTLSVATCPGDEGKEPVFGGRVAEAS